MARVRTRSRLLMVDAHSDDSAISSAGFLERVRGLYELHFVLVACSDVVMHHCGQVTRDQRLQEYDSYVRYFGGVWHRGPVLPFDADSRLDTIPKSRIVSAVEQVIAEVQPECLICHGASFHQDHTAVYEATIAAIRPTARHCPREVYIAENPTYVHSLGPHTDMAPDFFVRLTRADLARKVQCFRQCFPSQIRAAGNYLSPEGLRAWARYRGIEARCQYAEAFETYMRVI